MAYIMSFVWNHNGCKIVYHDYKIGSWHVEFNHNRWEFALRDYANVYEQWLAVYRHLSMLLPEWRVKHWSHCYWSWELEEYRYMAKLAKLYGPVSEAKV